VLLTRRPGPGRPPLALANLATARWLRRPGHQICNWMEFRCPGLRGEAGGLDSVERHQALGRDISRGWQPFRHAAGQFCQWGAGPTQPTGLLSRRLVKRHAGFLPPARGVSDARVFLQLCRNAPRHNDRRAARLGVNGDQRTAIARVDHLVGNWKRSKPILTDWFPILRSCHSVPSE